MDEYASRAKKLTRINTFEINSSVVKNEEGEYVHAESGLKDGERVSLACIIESRKNKTTRNRAQMAFLSLEDSYGSVECLVFPKTLSRYSSMLEEGNIVLVNGNVSLREDEEPKLLMDNVEDLESALKNADRLAARKADNIKAASTADENGIKRPIVYVRLKTRSDELLKKAGIEVEKVD